MSQQIDDGGSAFPHGEIVEEMRDEKGKTTGHRVYDAQPGMSLRDWLAGQALAHIGSEYYASDDVLRRSERHALMLASHAYSIADAMLAARNRPD
jgi:hypothetical protein